MRIDDHEGQLSIFGKTNCIQSLITTLISVLRVQQNAFATREVDCCQPTMEEEPRLKYAPLVASESPRTPALAPATRLCVSDKVLAVGHQDGTVRLLDHLGNEVRLQDHHQEGHSSCYAAAWPPPAAAAAPPAAPCSCVFRTPGPGLQGAQQDGFGPALRCRRRVPRLGLG